MSKDGDAVCSSCLLRLGRQVPKCGEGVCGLNVGGEDEHLRFCFSRCGHQVFKGEGGEGTSCIGNKVGAVELIGRIEG